MQTRRLLPAAGRALVLATALLAAACVDGDPSGVSAPASLSFLPSFRSAAALASQDISRIDVAVVTGSGSVLAERTFQVSPQAAQWDLDVDVDLRDVGDDEVFVTVELVSLTGGAPVVEWSGRIGPFRLRPGASAPQMVPVYPGPLENLDVTGVTVEAPARSELLEGETLQLQAQLAGAVDGARAVWSSLDPAVATVDRDGLVTTHLPGNARIVAQAGPHSAEVSLQVLAKLARVVLAPSTLEVEAIGAVGQFSAQAQDPRGGAIASGVSYSWQITNTSIAVHEGDGRFRAVSKGTSSVTVTASSTSSSVSQPPVSATGSLVVRQGVATISVSPTTLSFDRLGASAGVSATARDANGNVVSDAVFEWRSSDGAVASVSSSGVVAALGNGTANVTAHADNATGTVVVTVQQRVSTVTVTPPAASAEVGESVQFEATAVDPGGAPISGRSFSWSSSNEAVATVDASGLASAVANGSAAIQASLEDVSGSATLTVGGSAVEPGDYIAYQGGGTIRVMKSDGTEVRNTGQAGFHPTWSPDGSALAFSPQGQGGISLISPFAAPAGGQSAATTVLGDAGVQYLAPDWSPDGSRLAAHRDYASETSIALLNASSGAESRASTSFPFFDPDWHPDGVHLVVSYEGFFVYIMHPGDSDHGFISSPPGGYQDRFPEFSPDGSRIAFLRIAPGGSSAHVMVIQTDLFTGTNERVVAVDPYPSDFAGGIAWSPDGQWIAYACGSTVGDICKVRPDGTGHTNLTNSPTTGEYDPAWIAISAAPPGGAAGGAR